MVRLRQASSIHPHRDPGRRPDLGERWGTRWVALLGLSSFLAMVVCTPMPAVASETPLQVEGTVTDTQGNPLADAWVVLEAIEPPPVRAHRAFDGEVAEPVDQVTTGDDGLFRLVAPERGQWQVRVGKSGFAEQRLELRPLVFDRVLSPVALEPGTEVTVRLRDAEGQPIAGRVAFSGDSRDDAEGSWLESQWHTAWPRARTDGKPLQLTLPDTARDLSLEALAPGRRPVRRPGRLQGRIDLVLDEGSGRRVRALDPAGKPLPGVVVQAEGWQLPLAQTDASGVAEVVLPEDFERRLLLLGPEGEWARLDPEDLRAPRPASEGVSSPPLDVSLRTPYRVEGRVLDATQGDGLSGALVVSLSSAPGWVTKTDANGAYQLTTLRPEGTVFAFAEGYRDGSGRYQVSASEAAASDRSASTETLLIRGPALPLDPAASFAGRVLDVDRQPVANAEISIVLDFGGGFKATLLIDRSNADGQFSWPLAPPDMNFTLRAKHGTWAPAELEQLPYEAGEHRVGLELQLTPGLRGVGWVVDAWEEPVAGAVIRLLDGDRQPGAEVWLSADKAPTATTEASGRFVLPGLLPGRFDLEAKATGFAPLTVRGLELPVGEGDFDLGTLVLAEGVELAGRVVDAEGQPVADAQVVAGGADDLITRLSLFRMGEATEDARSGRDGRFVVGERVAGERVTLAAVKQGYVPATLGAVTVPTQEPVRLVLQPTTRILGRVVDADRRPVAGAVVRVAESGEAGGSPWVRGLPPSEATSGDDGRFELTEVELGPITLETQAKGFLKHRRSGLETSGEVLEGVELELERGATLEGTVFSASGDPALGAIVYLYAPDRGHRSELSITDDAGAYRLEGLPTGPTLLVASMDEGPTTAKSVEIQPGANSLDVRLEEGFEVRGRVVGPAGEPVGGATVTLGPVERKRTMGGGQETLSREGGVFVFEEVPEGRYQVWAYRDGYARGAQQEPFEVRGPVAGLEARLRHSITLRGRVLGLDTESLGQVTLRSMQSWQNAARPDFEGRYQLDDLAPGDHRVIAELGDGGRRTEGRIRLEDGVREAELDLEFADGALVTGTLHQGDSVVSGARVGLQGISVSYRSAAATSTHEGRFQLEGVPSGTYRLSVFETTSQLFHVEEVEIDGDVDLQVEIASSTVSGRVLLADGASASGARVQLIAQGDRPLFAPETATDSDGRFRFASVLAGPWRLRATLSGYVAASLDLEIEAGVPLDGLEMRLEPATDLVLAMRHAGAPRPGAVWLAALDPQGGVVAGGLFQGDDQGRVLVDQIPAGSWTLVLETTGFAQTLRPLVIPRGDSEPLVIELVPEAQIDVVVEDLESRPSWSEVRLVDASGRPHLWIRENGRVEATTSMRGSRRRLENLAAGLWTLQVTTQDGRRWQTQVSAQAGEVAEVRLTGSGGPPVDP